MRKVKLTSLALSAGLLLAAIPVLALAETNDWRAPVYLGTAGEYALLTESGITTTGTTKITGNLGVSPIASTAITGFGLVMDSSGRFSTSTLVTGRIYAANYAAPTPSKMTMAVSDMQRAYAGAAARKSPRATNLGSGNIGGLTLRPGLYKWSSGVLIPTNVTLSGPSNAVWIFQISGTLNLSTGTQVFLRGGAQDKNIFWQVAGATTLETGSVFHGIILDATSVSLKTGAKLNGRALAQTAVTLESNAITEPAPSAQSQPQMVLDSTGRCLAAACSALTP
jgi:hypothetical protein